MAAKKFYPRPAGMTKKDIARWMNDEIFVANDIIRDLTPEVEGENPDELDLERIEVCRTIADVKVVPAKISDRLAQDFVDGLHVCMNECVDSCEEDLVDMREEMIYDMIKRYARAR